MLKKECSFEDYCLINDIIEPGKVDYYDYEANYYGFMEYLVFDVEDQDKFSYKNIDKYIKNKWKQYGEQYIKFCEENDFMRDDFEE